MHRARNWIIGSATAIVLALASLVLLGQWSEIWQRVLPTARAVGGPFSLTSHSGDRVTSQSLLGKPFAIFFGFTQCPDVCPTTLLDISNHLAALGDKADRLKVLFVSVDHERDTPEHLKAYLQSFDPRIIGLTGSADEIAAIVYNYRVFFQKVPTSGGYTINHTATVYLMNSEGKFAGAMSFQEPAETQRAKLELIVGK